MSWFYIVIISNFLFAVVYALDKILVRRFLRPIQYALAIGILEGLVLALIPFVNFTIPNLKIILLALLGGASFIIGIYFFFRALECCETTWILPLLFGVGIPIISLVINYFWLNEKLDFQSILAFSFLVIGGLIISLGNLYSFSALKSILISSIFLSFHFTLLKTIFNHTNFWSGYITIHLGTFLLTFLILIFRNQLIDQLIEGMAIEESEFKLLLIFKQVLAFAANLLLAYAISLTSLTMVNGLGGLRYFFLLLIMLIISFKYPRLIEESFKISTIIKKLIAAIFIILGIFILSVTPIKTPGAKTWGITYSSLYTKQLGLNERETFLAILSDLKIKNFRLIAYWPEIEMEENKYNFEDLDFQVNSLEKFGSQAILTVGLRLPRWPECHEPEWIRNQKSNIKDQKLLNYLKIVVEHYKNSPVIWAWQIENEPFLRSFGKCPSFRKKFLEQEITLIKSLDQRPIIISDSGELGLWSGAYKRADILGTTMYRKVQSKFIPVVNYFTYPLGPDFFKFKASLMNQLYGPKEIINVELQTELWAEHRPPEIPLQEQLKIFSLNDFQSNIEYAKTVGFEKNYLWGVEWWFWLKEKQGHPEFWEEAKKLF